MDDGSCLTTGAAYNVLGSILRFISSDFKVVHVTAALIKNNVSHSGQHNVSMLDTTYKQRYDVNINADVKFMTSDTASAAGAVSTHFDE